MIIHVSLVGFDGAEFRCAFIFFISPFVRLPNFFIWLCSRLITIRSSLPLVVHTLALHLEIRDHQPELYSNTVFQHWFTRKLSARCTANRSFHVILDTARTWCHSRTTVSDLLCCKHIQRVDLRKRMWYGLDLSWDIIECFAIFFPSKYSGANSCFGIFIECLQKCWLNRRFSSKLVQRWIPIFAKYLVKPFRNRLMERIFGALLSVSLRLLCADPTFSHGCA